MWVEFPNASLLLLIILIIGLSDNDGDVEKGQALPSKDQRLERGQEFHPNKEHEQVPAPTNRHKVPPGPPTFKQNTQHKGLPKPPPQMRKNAPPPPPNKPAKHKMRKPPPPSTGRLKLIAPPPLKGGN